MRCGCLAKAARTLASMVVDCYCITTGFHIATALRGLRSREHLTQKQLSQMIGAKPSHISEMENGKRSIGKEMAKRLAKALRTHYNKVFL